MMMSFRLIKKKLLHRLLNYLQNAIQYKYMNSQTQKIVKTESNEKTKYKGK